MSLRQTSPVFDRFFNYLVEKATPQEILAFQISDEEQRRAEELTARNKAGTLTADEAAELEQMLEFNLLVGALRARALRALKQR